MAPSAVYAAASAKGKGKGKRTADDVEAEEVVEHAGLVEMVQEEEDSDEVSDDEEVTTTSKRARTSATSGASAAVAAKAASSTATYKQKTLILSSRGITHRMRHMMKDLAALLPHSKTGAPAVTLNPFENTDSDLKFGYL